MQYKQIVTKIGDIVGKSAGDKSMTDFAGVTSFNCRCYSLNASDLAGLHNHVDFT